MVYSLACRVRISYFSMPRRRKPATASAQNETKRSEGRVAKRQKIGVHEMGATGDKEVSQF